MNINFSDEAEIAPFAAVYVDLLYMSAILNGHGDGTFRPRASLTRAEAAVGIHKLLTLTADDKEADQEPAVNNAAAGAEGQGGVTAE